MKRIKDFILFLTVLAVLLSLFELIGQNFLFKDKLYFVNDIDHRMIPNSREDINSDGIRSKVEASNFSEDALNIIILGDSFIYGESVAYNKTIPQMLEAKVRANQPERQINVANFGWVSSSPLLSLRLLKDIGKKYNPKIVILTIDMTDFQDDIKYLHLLERKGIYSALDLIPITILTIRKTISAIGFEWLHEAVFGFPIRRFFVTDKPLSETKSYFVYIQNSIDKIYYFSKNELGAKFILFVFPRGYQYSDKESPNNWEKSEYQVLGPFAHEPFKYFEQIKFKVSYPIISLLPNFQNSNVFPTVLDDDPHWNEAGNKIAVDAIYQYCYDNGYFD